MQAANRIEVPHIPKAPAVDDEEKESSPHVLHGLTDWIEQNQSVLLCIGLGVASFAVYWMRSR